MDVFGIIVLLVIVAGSFLRLMFSLSSVWAHSTLSGKQDSMFSFPSSTGSQARFH